MGSCKPLLSRILFSRSLTPESSRMIFCNSSFDGGGRFLFRFLRSSRMRGLSGSSRTSRIGIWTATTGILWSSIVMVCCFELFLATFTTSVSAYRSIPRDTAPDHYNPELFDLQYPENRAKMHFGTTKSAVDGCSFGRIAVQDAGWVSLKCARGKSADRDVLIGFAPASTLGNVSFADVLDEVSNR